MPTSSPSRARTGRVVGLLTALALTAGLGQVLPAAPAQAATTVTPVAPLPFDPPSTASLRTSPKKVFAHYLPSLPVSLDNQRPPATTTPATT